MGIETMGYRHIAPGKSELRTDLKTRIWVLVVLLFLTVCSCSRSYEKLKIDMENAPAKQVLEAIIKLPPSEERIDSIELSSENETVYDTVTLKVYKVTADSTDFTLEYTPEKTINGRIQVPNVLIKEVVTSNSPLESIYIIDLGEDGKPDTVYFNFIVGTRVVNSNHWVPYTPGFDYTADDFDRIQKDGNPFIEKWYRDTILKPILNGLQSK